MSKKEIECTVLFADIAGSTRLYENLGDQKAQDTISQCLTRLSEITVRFGGVVIKTIGDELMARFETADAGVNAACAMHESLEGDITTGSIKLSIRVGLHTGSAILEGGDVFGDAVNVAARMTAVARAGQIITTEGTIALVSPENRDKSRQFDRANVKGKEKAINIHEVLWEQEDDVTRIVDGSLTKLGMVSTSLRLRYNDEEYILEASTSNFVMGRGNQCNICVPADLASRIHVRFEYSRGKFVLADQSTNGTFVKTQDGKEVYLRREELPLWGQGIISLGKSVEEESDHLVYFLCS